jgi:copper(I)-binding protein
MSCRLIRHGVAIAVLICGLAGLVRAEPTATIGTVAIHDAWARASLGQTGTSAVYMTLEASGEQGDRLIAAATPVARSAELHTHLMEGGVARMRPLAAIEIAPGEPAVLAPGGLHIMLTGLSEKLTEGNTVPLSLTFEHAGTVEIEVPIRGAGPGISHRDHQAPAD